MPVRINEKLNLVLTIFGEDGSIQGYVHSVPISYEVYEANYRLISQTYAEVMRNGADMFDMTGPMTALPSLRAVSRKLVGSDGDSEGMAQPLMAEMRRLSNAILPKDSGWEPVPFQVAIDRKLLSVEDIREVEGTLLFFTCCSVMLPRPLRVNLSTAVQAWGGQTSSLNVTAFIASLQTSTAIGSTGATEAA